MPAVAGSASRPTSFRASHALAVDDGGGWAGLAFGLLATLFVERVMDAIQHAINAPVAKVKIDSAARRRILGKITPLASVLSTYITALSASRMFVSRLRPPRLAGGMSGSTCAH